MTTRTRKDTATYRSYRLNKNINDDCIFCVLEPETKLIAETKSFRIVQNRFAYTLWDGQGVSNHLMIVPKQHTDTLDDLSSSEIIEFMDLLTSYEKRGYDFYGRAPLNNRKTVTHQHTHLLKLDRKSKKLIFYLKKPYLRIAR